MGASPQNRFADPIEQGPVTGAAHTPGDFAGEPAGGSSSDRPSGGERGPAAASRLAKELEELKQYAAYYAQTHLDRAKLTVRQAVLYGALAIVAATVGIALLCTASVLLLAGAAAGLGDLMGRPWLGNVLVGAVVIVVALLGVWLKVRSLTGSSRARTMKKYEQLRHQQHAHSGHDVHERATSDHPHANRE